MQRQPSSDWMPSASHGIANAFLAVFGKLSEQDCTDVRSALTTLADFTWPDVLRTSSSRLHAAAIVDDGSLDAQQQQQQRAALAAWRFVHDVATAEGYHEELREELRAPLAMEEVLRLDQQQGGAVSEEDDFVQFAAAAALVVRALHAVTHVDESGFRFFRFLTHSIDVLVGTSGAAQQQQEQPSPLGDFCGLYELAASASGSEKSKCPYVDVLKPWRHAIENLERAYGSITVGGAAPPPGFRDFTFGADFVQLVGPETMRQLTAIRGCCEVKQMIQDDLVLKAFMQRRLGMPVSGFGSILLLGNPGTSKSDLAVAIASAIEAARVNLRKVVPLADPDAPPAMVGTGSEPVKVNVRFRSNGGGAFNASNGGLQVAMSANPGVASTDTAVAIPEVAARVRAGGGGAGVAGAARRPVCSSATITFTVKGNNSWMVGAVPASKLPDQRSAVRFCSDSSAPVVNCDVSGVPHERHDWLHRSTVTATLDAATRKLTVRCGARVLTKAVREFSTSAMNLVFFGYGGAHLELRASASTGTALPDEAVAAADVAASAAPPPPPRPPAEPAVPVRFSGASLRGATVSSSRRRLQVHDGPTVVGMSSVVLPLSELPAAPAAAAPAAADADADAVVDVQSMSVSFVASRANDWMVAVVPRNVINGDHAQRLRWCNQPEAPVKNCDCTGFKHERDRSLHETRVTATLDAAGLFVVRARGEVKYCAVVNQKQLPATLAIFCKDGVQIDLKKATGVPAGAAPAPALPPAVAAELASSAALAELPQDALKRVRVRWDRRCLPEKLTVTEDKCASEWGPNTAVTDRTVVLPGQHMPPNGCVRLRVPIKLGGGRNDSELGAVPESQCSTHALTDWKPERFGMPSSLPSDTRIVIELDAATRLLRATAGSRVLAQQRLPESAFPARIGFCAWSDGHCELLEAAAFVPNALAAGTEPARAEPGGGGGDIAGGAADAICTVVPPRDGLLPRSPNGDGEQEDDDDDDDDDAESDGDAAGQEGEDGAAEEGDDGAGGVEEKNKFKVITTTGSALLLDKPEKFKEQLEDFARPEHEGCVIVIDEAYQLAPATNQAGALITNLMMHYMWSHRSKMSFVIAGYEEDIEKALLAHNPGLRGRFTHTFKLRDYHEGELYDLFYIFLERYGGGRFRVAPGHEQAVAIVARRMAKGAQSKRFDNARLVHRLVEGAMARCLKRLMPQVTGAGAAGGAATAATVVKHMEWQDILGMCPLAELRSNYKPLVDLQNMIGFPGIKRRLLQVLVNIVEAMVAELQGQRIEDVHYGARIYGHPGTGKTTVAMIYARCLADLGITAKADVIVEYPTNLKGVAVGEAEANVRAMLERARDACLFIDEAYQLLDDSPHSAAMMEALTSEISPSASFRPVIIIAGYADRMEKMLRSTTNPGLQRRLAPNPPLEFEGGDFSEGDLSILLRLKLRSFGAGAGCAYAAPSRRVVEHAVKLLLLERQRPNFGNGGAVEALALNALRAMQADKRRYLLEDDFGKLPPEVSAADGVLLSGSPLAAWFATKRDQVRRCQQRGVQPVLPTVYAFVGAGSGLGRKTEARELVRLLNGIQCCAGTAVREVSISAIVAKFVGQSTPKLLELLRESLGGMLLVTNAGRLLSTEFGCEVVRELFDAAARSEFAQKVVIGMTMRPEEFNAMCELEPAARMTQVFKYERPTAAVCADVAVMYMRKRQLFVAPDGSTLRSLRHALQLVRTSFDAVGCPNEFGGLRLATQLVELCDQQINGRWGDEACVWRVAAQLCHPSFVVPPYSLQHAATPPTSGIGAAHAAASGASNSSNAANYASNSNLIKAGRMGGGGQTASASDRANSVRTQAIVKTAVQPPARSDDAGVRDAAAPVVVEQLALLLEQAVADGRITEEAAADIAANHDFEAHEDATTGLPAELVSFMHRAGLKGDAMRKEAASMRARMKEARAKNLPICPICFLPEQPARQIGCPWSFR